MMEDDVIIYKGKNVQLREMICEMKWGDLSACKSQPTKWKLMEAYSQTLCRNVETQMKWDDSGWYKWNESEMKYISQVKEPEEDIGEWTQFVCC